MSKSRLEEMAEIIALLKENSMTIDLAIAETEYKLSLLRGIRQATKTGDEPRKPSGKKEAAPVAGKVG